jgi:hypothetical protein
LTKSYDRPGAARRLKELLGDGAPSQFTLPVLPIAYSLQNGRAIYQDSDLQAYANQVKAKAIRRIGGRRRLPINSREIITSA